MTNIIKSTTPKSRKILISFDEYQAIEFALEKIDITTDARCLPAEEAKKYKVCGRLLRNILTKIINK